MTEMPELPDFTVAAFGENFWVQGDWRRRRPGDRIVTKKEMAKVVAAWQAACLEASR